ncbi:hypothetical protein, partial [Streptococcus dysgalactiae]|uniref:hypothetical protein n=1 Tax=Streptococcus dysgalactiae TaxID=1334 RepID=UPI00194FB114
MSTEEIRVLMQQQLKLMELFSQKLCTASERSNAKSSVITAESIASTITEFHFDSTANLTFEAWFKRFEDIFLVEFAAQDDACQVRMLLRKLGSVEHDRFISYILPKTPSDYNFNQIVDMLKDIFGEQSSLFNIRFHCMNLTKSESDDFITYAGIANRECERFKLGSITSDQFKCLIFVCGLRSCLHADIRTRILSKIEQNP